MSEMNVQTVADMETAGVPVLKLEHLTMQFGGVIAVNDFSMHIDQGEIVALIGPNGAGKTTAFNCVTSVYQPTGGRIYFKDQEIGSGRIHHTPDKITRMGIARTFQNIRLFSGMTVMDNVMTAMHLRRKSNLVTQMLHINAEEERANREKAWKLLETVGLTDVAEEMATSLPYGKQRLLEIARALATDPVLLLLDEPAAGMNPQETAELGEFIVRIKEQFNLTVFMIEHHMNLVMDISDRIYVLDFGKPIANGTPEEVQQNPVVIAAYLGVEEE